MYSICSNVNSGDLYDLDTEKIYICELNAIPGSLGFYFFKKNRIVTNDLIMKLGIKTKETLRSSYLNPAIENHLVVMTLPDKPNSKNQKYVRL